MKLAAVIALAPLVSAKEWYVKVPRIATIAFGVDAPSDGSVFVATIQDGVGNAVLKSSDDAGSFTPLQSEFSMLMMGMAASSSESACVGGTKAQTTQDGAVFTESSFTAGRMVATQNVEKSPSGQFGIPGDFFTGTEITSGIAVSLSGGEDFTVYQTAKFTQTSAWPRYAALPSDNVWYVACGTWSASKSGRQLSDRIFLDEANALSFRNESVASAQGLDKSNNGYAGEILKTTDGGATFMSVYTTEGSIYFNGIDCASEDVCMVTAEGNTAGNDSGTVWGTTDGGESWELLFQDPEGGPGVGLFQVRMLSEQEAWAAGGNLGVPGFEARFFHTTDGGSTWEVEKIPQVYANEFSMASSEVGYATAFTIDSQSSLLAYGV